MGMTLLAGQEVVEDWKQPSSMTMVVHGTSIVGRVSGGGSGRRWLLGVCLGRSSVLWSVLKASRWCMVSAHLCSTWCSSRSLSVLDGPSPSASSPEAADSSATPQPSGGVIVVHREPRASPPGPWWGRAACCRGRDLMGRPCALGDQVVKAAEVCQCGSRTSQWDLQVSLRHLTPARASQVSLSHAPAHAAGARGQMHAQGWCHLMLSDSQWPSASWRAAVPMLVALARLKSGLRHKGGGWHDPKTLSASL